MYCLIEWTGMPERSAAVLNVYTGVALETDLCSIMIIIIKYDFHLDGKHSGEPLKLKIKFT
jgi:hypothetical protein